MRGVLLEPVVPSELLPYWDDHAREAYARLASMSLDQVIEAMPPSHDPTPESVRYVDLIPGMDYDPKRAIAFTTPYTNGWRPHIAIRAMALQGMLPEPTRVIVFPDNRLFETAYDLTNEELAQVDGGDFGPIADKQAFTLDNLLGIEEVHVVGGSEGASVGAAFLRRNAVSDRFKQGSSGLFEPPNCEKRENDVKGLERAFFETKLRDLNVAIRDSAIPALTEAQRANGGVQNINQSLRIGWDYLVSKKNKTMRAVKSGMATDTFASDLHEIRNSHQDFSVTIAGGSDSAIFRREVQDHFRRLFATQSRIQTDFVTIQGEKHTMMDNVVLHALLGRRAVIGQLAA